MGSRLPKIYLCISMKGKALSRVCEVIQVTLVEERQSAVDLGLVLPKPWSLRGRMPECCLSHLLAPDEDLQKTLCAAKISFKYLVGSLGLYAVFITIVGFPSAVEGVRTRNLGHRGLSGSWLTSGIAHGRKLQAHRGSGEQMEHVSCS